MQYLFDNSTGWERIIAIKEKTARLEHPVFDYALWLSVIMPLLLGTLIVFSVN